MSLLDDILKIDKISLNDVEQFFLAFNVDVNIPEYGKCKFIITSENIESIFNSAIKLNIPFGIDFICYENAMYNYTSQRNGKEIIILYDENNNPYISVSMNNISDIELDEHNKKLLQMYKLIELL